MGALKESFMRRSNRVRHTLRRAANGRARLSVFRSSKHIYAQVIDDQAGKTVAAASTLDKDLKGALPKGSDLAAAQAVGGRIASHLAGSGEQEASVMVDQIAGAAIDVDGVKVLASQVDLPSVDALRYRPHPSHLSVRDAGPDRGAQAAARHPDQPAFGA